MKKVPVVAVVLALCLISAPALAATAQSAPADIRILIDISGSMKISDPDNERASSLPLLAEILPPGVQAGIWTFARYANMLVPLRQVDSAWIGSVREKTSQIKDWGAYKDLANVLKRATWDWKESDGMVNRQLIMVTDGWVTVSTNPQDNRASRRNILEQLLPRLLAAGVRIHCIALGDEIDEPLLRTLAMASGGSYQQVDPSNLPLSKAFLSAVESMGLVNESPLINQTALIDDQIKSMSFVLFNDGDKSQQVEIRAPNGRRFLRGKQNGDDVQWLAFPAYDVIDISTPVAGQWNISGMEQPDNRVYVATDLRLDMHGLDGVVLEKHAQPITLSLARDGSVVRDKGYLELATFGIVQDNADRWHWTLNDDGRDPDARQGDGVFTGRLGASLSTGHHEIIAYVDGVKFRRQVRRSIDVLQWPVFAMIVPQNKAYGMKRHLSVIADPAELSPQTLKISVAIDNPASGQASFALEPMNAWEWGWEMPQPGPDLLSHIIMHVTGLDRSGKAVTMDIEPDFSNYRKLLDGSFASERLPAPSPALSPPVADNPKESVAATQEKPVAQVQIPPSPPGGDRFAAPKNYDQLVQLLRSDKITAISLATLLLFCILLFSLIAIRKRRRLALQQVFEKVWAREPDRRKELIASLQNVYQDEQELAARADEIIQAENRFHQRLLDALSRKKINNLSMLDHWTDEMLTVYKKLLVDRGGEDVVLGGHLRDKLETMARAIAALQEEKDRIAQQLDRNRRERETTSEAAEPEKLSGGESPTVDAAVTGTDTEDDTSPAYNKIHTLTPRNKK